MLICIREGLEAVGQAQVIVGGVQVGSWQGSDWQEIRAGFGGGVGLASRSLGRDS